MDDCEHLEQMSPCRHRIRLSMYTASSSGTADRPRLGWWDEASVSHIKVMMDGKA